jgi:glycosyltransferase involved in cell wall biosynthesis
VILQNPEDRQYFVTRCVFAERDIRVIRGSGVDLNHFVPCAEAPGVPVIVCASRMLKAKGIADFVAAANLAKERRIAARFVLVGAPDAGNPQSHTEEELERWVRDGSVEWWGFRSDMRTVFVECHVACLPTFYGEGVPKVLIEAAACGRPIVATDMPGCREIVRNGDTGFLVKPRDPLGLITALERLVCDPDLRLRMGQRARGLAESQFSLQAVIRETLAVYNEFAR